MASSPSTQSDAVGNIDATSLQIYLKGCLPGFEGEMKISRFDAGQSNPTFRIECGAKTYVLRKRPPGKLLPSAHAVDREYRVLSALSATRVPVPQVLHMCEDPEIIGTDFYLMDFVEGEIFHDPGLPGKSKSQRRAFYTDFVRVLAALHNVDVENVGLSSFGKPTAFIERQVSRWSQQYEISKTEDIPSMQKLVEWLPANVPDDPSVSIVHGDFRPGNTIVDPETNRIKAVLDWELSTLGHPLADLGYCLANYHGAISSQGNFSALDHAELGIPTADEFVEMYCDFSGRKAIENAHFYVVFSLFRSAAIIQGVYKRGLQGNASSSKALGFGHLARQRADIAWEIVRKHL